MPVPCEETGLGTIRSIEVVLQVWVLETVASATAFFNKQLVAAIGRRPQGRETLSRVSCAHRRAQKGLQASMTTSKGVEARAGVIASRCGGQQKVLARIIACKRGSVNTGAKTTCIMYSPVCSVVIGAGDRGQSSSKLPRLNAEVSQSHLWLDIVSKSGLTWKQKLPKVLTTAAGRDSVLTEAPCRD